jgi:hypothetical protein
MRIKLQNIYLYTFLITTLVGCRGCNCSPPKTFILEKMVQEIELDKENNAKIQIEHLKKKKMGFTLKFKKHGGKASYAVRYNLQLNDRPYRKAIFEHDAEKTDSVQQYKKDISLEISADQQHLLIKHLGEPIDVYHILPTGAPFSTTFKKVDLKKNIAAFRQKTLKNPANLLTDYVEQMETEEQFANNLSIKETLDAQEGICSLDKNLLELVGKPLADYYFTKQGRISYLCTHDKDWRTRAMKKVYRFVGEASRAKHLMPKETLQNATGAVNLFVHGLADQMDKRAIERLVLPQYPLYPYTVEVYKLEHHRTLRKNEAQSIEKNCKKILANHSFRKDLPDQQLAADAAIEFLIQYRDDKNINAFKEIMKAVFQKEILLLELKNIESEIFFPYDSRFSEKEQAIIIKQAQKVAKELDKKEENFHLKAFLKRFGQNEETKKRTS